MNPSVVGCGRFGWATTANSEMPGTTLMMMMMMMTMTMILMIRRLRNSRNGATLIAILNGNGACRQPIRVAAIGSLFLLNREAVDRRAGCRTANRSRQRAGAVFASCSWRLPWTLSHSRPRSARETRRHALKPGAARPVARSLAQPQKALKSGLRSGARR